MKKSLRRLASLVAAVAALFVLSPASPAPAANGQGVDLYFYSWASSPRTDGYSEPALTGTCAILTGVDLNFDWGSSAPTGCPNDKYWAYGTGTIYSPTSGTVYFCASTDDGLRVKIGETMVLDRWRDQGPSTCNATGTLQMVAGRSYPLKLWWYENGGGAVLRLKWSLTGPSNYVPVPMENLSNGRAAATAAIDYPAPTWSCEAGVPTPSAPAVEGIWRQIPDAPGAWALTANRGVFPDGSPTLTYRAPDGVCAGQPGTAGSQSGQVSSTTQTRGVGAQTGDDGLSGLLVTIGLWGFATGGAILLLTPRNLRVTLLALPLLGCYLLIRALVAAWNFKVTWLPTKGA